MLKNIQYKIFIIPLLEISIILGTIIVPALSVTTLVKINKKFDDNVKNGKRSTINSKTLQQSSDSILSASIRIEEVMSHLNELQRIATASNGTRSINTPGFNGTLDYISNYLTANTNYNVTKTFFSVEQTLLARQPVLISSINNTITNHTYSMDGFVAEFGYIIYTTSANFTDFIELTVIPNVGCSDDDWRNATPSPTGRVALVKRGECTDVKKGVLAAKYNVAALLIYNDGTAPHRLYVMNTALSENNTLPALFLSYKFGQNLADAAQQTPGNVKILINIVRFFESPFPPANICADTPTGDITQTIVIGSHSDSVRTGPGINDNGKVIISIIPLILWHFFLSLQVVVVQLILL
jgi:Zn-dependent M28 family amino/carboxypeptidase